MDRKRREKTERKGGSGKEEKTGHTEERKYRTEQ
jgi:hypothetical protein